jgi:hypothetical protein
LKVKGPMTLCNRQAGSHPHLWSLFLSALVAIVLLEPEDFAALQNPQKGPPNPSRQSHSVRPHLAAGDTSQSRSNLSSNVTRNSQPPVPPAVQPAAVTLNAGTLTIEANNSALSQILQDVSRQSGMIIQGTVKDVRVFGTYGPRNPQDILTQLLAGLGYNIVMVGTSRQGAPRELMLTSRLDGPSPSPPVKAPENTVGVDLGPGAVAHAPPPPPDHPHGRARPNHQNRGHMHESQQRQNVP